MSRLNVTWDETEGPAVENVGPAGFGTKLLQSALRAFDGKTDDSLPQDRRSLHDAMPDSGELEPACNFRREHRTANHDRCREPRVSRVDTLLMTIAPIAARKSWPHRNVTVFRSST